MAIRTVITRGYGNGTFNGTIPLAVTRGYAIGAAVILNLQVYTADVYCNPSPVVSLNSNITPSADVDANPTPAEELYSG